ncbi:MAG: translation initiation factor IF-6 [Candidatus Altiarchaeota archaeon]
MHADQVTVHGEDFIGLLGTASDRYAVISPEFEFSEILDVPTLKTKIYGTKLVGIFCTGNSNGVLVPYFISDTEFAAMVAFMKPLGVEVMKVKDKYTAVGNMVAANDKKAFISNSLTRDYKEIEDALGVEAVLGDVGGHIEVGAYIFATNKGFLAHPDAESQLPQLKELFKVGGMVGTVNCGIPYVKSGLIANSNGYITGGRTTPIEMQRIEDALGFF